MGGRRGGEGGPGAMGGGRGGWGRGSRPMFRLTELIHIEQSAGGLQLSDSLGGVLGEILLGQKKGSEEAAGVPRLSGSWHGDQLETMQTNDRGGQVTQTYHLAGDGRTLEVKTRMQRPGDVAAREFVRVYRKEGTS